MPNPLIYASTTPDHSLHKGGVAVGVNSVEYNPSNGWINGAIPTDWDYVIYKTTSGANPNIFAPANEQEFYNFVLMQGGSASDVTSVGAALAWIATQSDLLALHSSLPNIATDGLVLALDAGNVSSYPTTGTTWYDVSGVGADWTVPSSAYSSGVMNYASNQSSLSPPAPWQSTTDLTIEVLYKPNTGGIYTGCCDTIFGRYYFRFFQIGTNLYTMIGFNNGSGGSFYQHPAISVSYDRWHHIVGARRDNRFIIWVDGVERYNTTYGSGYALFNPGETWYLSTSRQTNVDFSTCRIYDKGLSDNEILQNYYQAPIVTDGLVFAMDPGNLVSFENGTTTTYSLTGSIEGTNINGLGFNSSYGGVFDFDGSDDRIQLGNQPTMVTSDITQEAWVNGDAFVNWHGIISNMSGWGTGFSLQIGITQNISAMISGDYLRTSWTPSTGVWYHIVATHRSSDNLNVLYVNGIQENTVTRGISYNANAVTEIGVFYTGGGLPFNGKMGPLRTYNRALTLDEVQQNFQAQASRFI